MRSKVASFESPHAFVARVEAPRGKQADCSFLRQGGKAAHDECGDTWATCVVEPPIELTMQPKHEGSSDPMASQMLVQPY